MDDGKCPENQNKIGKYLDWPYKGHICTLQKCLAEWQESCHIEAEILNAGDKQSPPSEDTSSTDDITAIAASNDGKSLQTHIEEMMDLRAIVKNTYHQDRICAKIIMQPEAYPRFGIQEGLIWMKNQLKCDVICIPWYAFQRGRRLIKIIIDHTHQTIGCRGHICPLQGQSKYFPILFWFSGHFPSSIYASTLSQHLWILFYFLRCYFIFYYLQ